MVLIKGLRITLINDWSFVPVSSVRILYSPLSLNGTAAFQRVRMTKMSYCWATLRNVDISSLKVLVGSDLMEFPSSSKIG